MSIDMTPLSAMAIFIRNGASIKQEDGAGGDPITRIETIANREVNLNKCGYADVSAEDYENYILDTGDILISHINSTKHLGKCAIYNGKKGNVIHGMNLLCLRPNKDIADPAYVYFMLSSPLFLNQLPKITKNSVNQSSFNVKSFNELQIPLPPLETQKQIAAVLEKADQLRKDCKLMEQELNSLAQSVFIDMFGDPVTNPKGWSRHKLGEVLSINHGYAFKSEFFTTQGDYVLLTPGNFYEEGGYWDRAEKQKYYSGAIPDGYVLEKDDLLLAMTEQAAGLLGSAILIPESNKYLHNQRLGLVRFKDLNQNSVFYAYLFNNKSVRLAIHSLATGTKVRHTSPTKLEAIEVGIPPCDLQKKFEVIIHSIDQKLKLNSKAKLEVELSFNSLIQKAFKGQLNLKTKAA